MHAKIGAAFHEPGSSQFGRKNAGNVICSRKLGQDHYGRTIVERSRLEGQLFEIVLPQMVLPHSDDQSRRFCQGTAIAVPWEVRERMPAGRVSGIRTGSWAPIHASFGVGASHEAWS
jgi:hypothetical protein